MNILTMMAVVLQLTLATADVPNTSRIPVNHVIDNAFAKLAALHFYRVRSISTIGYSTFVRNGEFVNGRLVHETTTTDGKPLTEAVYADDRTFLKVKNGRWARISQITNETEHHPTVDRTSSGTIKQYINRSRSIPEGSSTLHGTKMTVYLVHGHSRVGKYIKKYWIGTIDGMIYRVQKTYSHGSDVDEYYDFNVPIRVAIPSLSK